MNDLTSGLKNAIERGSSLEKAMQSLINAGYSQQEVREAANSLTQGATTITRPHINLPHRRVDGEEQHLQQLQKQEPLQQPQSPSSKKTIFLIIILILFLILILGGIGALVYFYFLPKP